MTKRYDEYLSQVANTTRALVVRGGIEIPPGLEGFVRALEKATELEDFLLSWMDKQKADMPETALARRAFTEEQDES